MLKIVIMDKDSLSDDLVGEAYINLRPYFTNPTK